MYCQNGFNILVFMSSIQKLSDKNVALLFVLSVYGTEVYGPTHEILAFIATASSKKNSAAPSRQSHHCYQKKDIDEGLDQHLGIYLLCTHVKSMAFAMCDNQNLMN